MKGNQFNSIFSGIKLFRFEDKLCLDIDGNYPLGGNPSSLNEVKQYGEFYVIAKEIEIDKLELD